MTSWWGWTILHCRSVSLYECAVHARYRQLCIHSSPVITDIAGSHSIGSIGATSDFNGHAGGASVWRAGIDQEKRKSSRRGCVGAAPDGDGIPPCQNSCSLLRKPSKQGTMMKDL